MNRTEWRIAHNEGIDALIAFWTRERPVAHICEALQRFDVVLAAGFPLKFSRSHAGHEAAAPVPGGDTAAVLGLSEAQLQALRARGIV